MAGIEVGPDEFVNSGVLENPKLSWLGDIFVWPEPMPFCQRLQHRRHADRDRRLLRRQQDLRLTAGEAPVDPDQADVPWAARRAEAAAVDAVEPPFAEGTLEARLAIRRQQGRDEQGPW